MMSGSRVEVRAAGPPSARGERRFVLRRADFAPAYLRLWGTGELQARARAAVESLRACRTCPRACGVNRLQGEFGVCRMGRWTRVASAFPHFGEEDCLRGWRGSGTIFFSGCNLRCAFCQNFDISQQASGEAVTAEDLAELMLALQAAGCHNINFVTPEHVVPQILEALPRAVERGLRLPLVYNTSAYDSSESLRWLGGVVDIYMPDFKLWFPAHCATYLGARDYADAARAAIAVMHAQVGELVFDEDGLALRGVLVRHLVMPGLLADTHEILRWLATRLSPDTYVNLMDQYRPAYRVGADPWLAAINRPLTRREYAEAVAAARAAGLWRLDARRTR